MVGPTGGTHRVECVKEFHFSNSLLPVKKTDRTIPSGIILRSAYRRRWWIDMHLLLLLLFSEIALTHKRDFTLTVS